MEFGVRGLQMTSKLGFRCLPVLTNSLVRRSTLNVHQSASSIPSVVSTKWLQERIRRKQTKDELRVIDVTWEWMVSGKEPYEKEHIPSSVFLDLNHCVRSTQLIPESLPEIGCFSEYVASLGISNDHHLVVYDRSAMYSGFFSAPRAWWLFRLFGHENVSVLNGGLLRWKLDGLPVTTETPCYSRGRFEAKMKKELIRTYEDVLANVNTRAAQLIDARMPGVFSGKEREKNPRLPLGHIPGAINMPIPTLIDKKTQTLKSKEELLEAFKTAKIDLSKPLMSMCLLGIRACGLALAADIAGKPNVPVYYGSWMDYGQRAPKDKVAKGSER